MDVWFQEWQWCNSVAWKQRGEGFTLSSSLHLESSALAVNDSRKRRIITCFANQMQDLFSYCCSFSIAHHLSVVENQLPQLRELGVRVLSSK